MVYDLKRVHYCGGRGPDDHAADHLEVGHHREPPALQQELQDWDAAVLVGWVPVVVMNW